jgi:hypothetical protein
VYSLFLKNASKVFAVMLGPNFSEGEKISQITMGSAVELDFPEDDAEALSIIFRVIHGRNESIHQTLTSEQVLSVAITADKYDCIVPLAFAIEHWFNPRNLAGLATPKQKWEMMTAAYWVCKDRSFTDLSLALMLNYSGSFLELARTSRETELALLIAVMLEQRRAKMRADLMQLLIASLITPPEKCPCGWASKNAMFQLNTMQSPQFGLLPQGLGLKTISQAMELAQQMPNPAIKPIPCKDYQSHGKQNYSVAFKKEIARFKKEQIGLCLGCVKIGMVFPFTCGKH